MNKHIISPRFRREGFTFYSDSILQMEHITSVKQKLENGVYHLKANTCICGESKGVVIAEVERYGLPLNSELCLNCGTVRINPYPDEESITDFYAHEYQYMYNRSSDNAVYFERQKQYGVKFLSLAEPFLQQKNWVLEVGCGAGGALVPFLNFGCKVAGCDYDARLLEYGKKNGISDLYFGSLNNLNKHLPLIKAELIFMNHVFEHVENPLELLKSCKQKLSSSGKIIISVPDLTRVDQFDFFKGNLLPMFHIAHKYNFTVEGLTILAGKAGLKLKILQPDSNIVTHTSIMPEIWVEFKPANEVKFDLQPNIGNKVINKLQQLEKIYQKRSVKRNFRSIIQRMIYRNR
ncbi:hypothetical protein AHMF7605_00220 [Adhaeribacter arboris]|uniref:Class I SAM-dependent methyltransferase n=1 Tax=Adhaeribacter arboris TaxID=2072846 RepID=A0A2T2Y971_9BACT|nr:class I SAM-dependent methyltransferase [Adhaeribacter arboris]PSR52053.1 hypothetical protein AHMF7605_00220 [Adhaeribacter arboris]